MSSRLIIIGWFAKENVLVKHVKICFLYSNMLLEADVKNYKETVQQFIVQESNAQLMLKLSGEYWKMIALTSTSNVRQIQLLCK